ncbi:MAG: biotin--[acetyl-CoA-carboxylase] ligase, partial [Gammaproteobacteria bacterium]|nr:biotin--[acetyl-CoA-carboxylase] ligase [Gammaproteobacteria bacterium]
SEAATLTFSLGLPLVPVSWSGLSLVVGVSVAESLDPDKTVPLTLKWPNDLWVWGRKLGGILVETALLQGDASERYVVIGTGLNLEPRDGLGGRNEPASLSEWRADATASTVLNELIVPLATAVRQFESEGFAPFGPRFEARDALRGLEVELSDGRRGRCEGVGSEGALLVRTDAGLSSITSAEVSVRPASGSFA